MKKSYLYLLVSCIAFFTSCEKEIDPDVGDYESKIVVEGSIEQGGFPTVIITKSLPYYTVINEESIAKMFVNDAAVSVKVGTETIPLIKLCLSDIPDSLRKDITELLNLPPAFNQFCIYTSRDSRLIGRVNLSYELMANVGGKQVTSITTIPSPVPLDSIWFKPDNGADTLGFIYAKLSDPIVNGNAYRWFAQRINHYTAGLNKGAQKDANFIAPFGSVFDDEFFNGKTFDFPYNRGAERGSEKEDDTGPERGYFKSGDTVVVKFTTIDQNVYQYYRTLENSVGSSGSPFSAPTNVKSNIIGGLGVWAGYGVSLDTLVIK